MDATNIDFKSKKKEFDNVIKYNNENLGKLQTFFPYTPNMLQNMTLISLVLYILYWTVAIE